MGQENGTKINHSKPVGSGTRRIHCLIIIAPAYGYINKNIYICLVKRNIHSDCASFTNKRLTQFQNPNMIYFLLRVVMIIIVLFSIQQPLEAQDHPNDSNPVLTSNGLTYQDFIDSLSCEGRSFKDNYVLLTTIQSIKPFDITTSLYKRLLSQAKIQKEKKHAFSLYNSIANNYLLSNEPAVAKLYLDSAFHQYIHEIEDSTYIGSYYYIEGRYYSEILEESNMINSYYKSISYFSKDIRYRSTIIMLLYNIAGFYYQYKDAQSLRNIKNQLLDLANEVNELGAFVQSYSVASAYHEICWGNDSILSDRDSVVYYNKKAVEEYENSDVISKRISLELVTQSYVTMADFMVTNINTKECMYTWDEIAKYVETAEGLLTGYDTENLFKCYYLRARIHEHYGRYGESLRCAEKSLEIIDNGQVNTNDKIYLVAVYTLLAKLEENYNKNYKAALKYTKLLVAVQAEIQSDKKYKVGKELEAKYETAKKDLEIATLQVETEREKQNKALLLVVGLLVVILLVILLLYNRIQRLRKEKEAAGLSVRMKEKELEFQSTIAQSELHGMQSYLKGLETERERLAKELHDHVANELLSIDLQLKDIQQVPEETSSQIENLHTEIRNISHELMPPLFKYASLPEIISDYLIKAAKNTLHIDLRMEDDGIKSILELVPEKYALEIYRIIQEAISNIIKHAEASTAQIAFYRSGDFLKLTIGDNGKGFDVHRKQTGIGLQIINDRITSLNGEINISSKLNNGSEITLSFPIFQLTGCR